jgi:hypothetical protein
VVGGLSCFLGYRKFRYGEEVEQIAATARKAGSTKGGSSLDWLPVSTTDMFDTVKRLME